MSYDNCQLNLFFFLYNLQKNATMVQETELGYWSIEGTGSHLGANTEIGKVKKKKKTMTNVWKNFVSRS